MAERDLFVCVKQAVSIEGALSLAPGEKALAPECRRWVPNEADAFALEEALRLRETGRVNRVTCLTVGPEAASSVLAWSLAMGADRALRIHLEGDALADSVAVGTILAAAVARENGRLVFAAQRSDDGGSGIVPAALAHALGAAYLSNVISVSLENERVEIQRKLERGNRQVWTAALPAVVAFEPGANFPRYVSVAALAVAQRRPVDDGTPRDVGCDPAAIAPLVRLQRLATPRVRPKKTVSLTSGQSVADRLKMIMSGGMTDKKEKKVLKGAPDQLASEVIKLLRERQLLGQNGP